MAYLLSGLGQTGDEVLNPNLVPFRSSPVYLRLATTRSRALDYAAGGFHVSVVRGRAGGCRDSAVNIRATGPDACDQPLGRSDLKQLWTSAAKAYLDAFKALQTGLVSVEILRVANAEADRAYAAEGVEPPRDPKTQTSEPPLAQKRGIPPLAMMGGLALLGFLLFRDKGKKKKGRARPKKRRRTQRRRRTTRRRRRR